VWIINFPFSLGYNCKILFPRSVVMSIITVGLNPAIDRILECRGFHIGGNQRVRQIARLAAGKAANVNRALAQFGVDSIATGFVGANEVQFFHEQLMAAGSGGHILCRFVGVGTTTRENMTILDTDSHGETHLRDRGLVVTHEETCLLEQKLTHELDVNTAETASSIVVFAGSLCEGCGIDYFVSLLDKCVAKGARVVVDASGESLRAAATRNLWLLKPNLEEFRQLVGREVPNTATAIRDAAVPFLKNIQNLLVSRGSMGAVLITPDGAWSGCIATPITPIRTVSCGDHLLAGYLANLAHTHESALAAALSVATARALSPRMDQFDFAFVESSLPNIVIEKM